MSDVFTKEQRSIIMRKVKSSNNKTTEQKLISYFKEKKITGWRRKYKIFGKPDFVFLKRKLAIFTDGCFWHGHDCRNLSPAANKEYWDKKIAKNQSRDESVNKYLEGRGWTVIRLWECQIRKKEFKILDNLICPSDEC